MTSTEQIYNPPHINISGVLKLLLACLLIMPHWQCYNFKGISIPEGAKNFYIKNFEDISDLQLPNYNITFTEALKDKIRNESRLKWNETAPDIEFSGKVIGFSVSAVAPIAGATTAFNRLEVTVEVTYTNHLDPKANWTKKFSQFDNFDAQQNLLEAQTQILPGITTLLTEYIFNAAFTDW
jgi:hypothetical protein